MKPKLLFLSFIIVILLYPLPLPAENFITPEDAYTQTGRTGTVCGTVASTYYAQKTRKRPTFLNFNRPYPSQPFSAVIWASDRHQFSAPPEEDYKYQDICITGRVSEYRGKPQMVLRSPSQITQYTPALPLCTRVVDGDTIIVITEGRRERVRLIGVDTPETKHPDKPVEYFGKEASQYTRTMTEGKRVRLEFDWQKRDEHGRLLAYVYLEDGTFLNEEIIRQGYGHAYRRFPYKRLDRFRKLEGEARENMRGLWKKSGEIQGSH